MTRQQGWHSVYRGKATLQRCRVVVSAVERVCQQWKCVWLILVPIRFPPSFPSQRRIRKSLSELSLFVVHSYLPKEREWNKTMTRCWTHQAGEVDPIHTKRLQVRRLLRTKGDYSDDWSHDFQYHHQYAKGIHHCHRAACIMALSKKTNENLSVARVNGQKKEL
jgi:hypothetical protein